MNRHIIYGIHIQNRGENALRVQQVLTEYGGFIKTRLGLHEMDGDKGSTGGVLLLEMHGDENRYRVMRDKLSGIDGIEVKVMEFDHG
ncbi:MAG TPA: hypothetical protein PLJ27_24785 [Polyangiaceae bacterium]|jgi:hypothetical protein|nr:MAG: hypothetical protein BWY17_04371 [Deltaproteobacteria bacterium ADurb.Bin207]HNS96339.1 hypothetical protein [Polyangiaceae bacterium]HNZ24261.1 hypothetical protein [Polyangiaceae bacterium]HOD24818.1 hypothetical protein [Polyangiaceae bacterium]HOE49682.1 hypothetical protein [Polyangiaceae bacterium]